MIKLLNFLGPAMILWLASSCSKSVSQFPRLTGNREAVLTIEYSSNKDLRIVRFTGNTLSDLACYVYFYKRPVIYKYNNKGQLVDSLSLPKKGVVLFDFIPLNGLDSVLFFANSHGHRPRRLIRDAFMLSNKSREWSTIAIVDSSLSRYDTNWTSPGSAFLLGSLQADASQNPSSVYVSIVPGTKGQLLSHPYPVLAKVDLESKKLIKSPLTQYLPNYGQRDLPMIYTALSYQISGDSVFLGSSSSDTVYSISLDSPNISNGRKVNISSRIYGPLDLALVQMGQGVEVMTKDIRQVQNYGLIKISESKYYKIYYPPVNNVNNQNFGFIEFDNKLKKGREYIYNDSVLIAPPFYSVRDGLICTNRSDSRPGKAVYTLLNNAGAADIKFGEPILSYLGYDKYCKEIFKSTPLQDNDVVLVVHLSKFCPSCIQGFVEKLNKANCKIVYIDEDISALNSNIEKHGIDRNRANVVTDGSIYSKYFSPVVNPTVIKFNRGAIAKKEILNPRSMNEIDLNNL